MKKKFKKAKSLKASAPKPRTAKPKFKIDNKMKWQGETDTNTNVVKINLTRSKAAKKHMRNKRYANVADTIQHELLHVKHPKMTEKEVYKKAPQIIKHASKAYKQKLYSMVNAHQVTKVKKMVKVKSVHRVGKVQRSKQSGRPNGSFGMGVNVLI